MAKNIIDDGKTLLKSKTFWFGALVIANAVAALFGFNEFKLNEDAQKILELVIGIAVIALRLVTTQPITRIK